MARARKASDEIYNLRRRAKRAAARLEAKGMTSEAREMRSEIAQTYAFKDLGGYGAGLGQTLQRLESLRARTRELSRSEQTFKREFNAMSRDVVSGLSSRGEIKAKMENVIFWQATRRLWEGAPPERRLEEVAAKLGFDDIQETYNYVMENQQEALQKLEEFDPSKSMQDDITAGEKQRLNTSPIEILASVNVFR